MLYDSNLRTEEPLSSWRERCTEKNGAAILRSLIKFSKKVGWRDWAMVPNAMPMRPSFGCLPNSYDWLFTDPNA